MSPLASVKAAFRALQAHKLRATLTALGIIIGVAAVIAMVAIAQGASAAVQARISSLGSHPVRRPCRSRRRPEAHGQGRRGHRQRVLGGEPGGPC
jgi:ABC-type lipoprotein release transport system permease subunit